MNPVLDIHALNFSYGSVPTLSGIARMKPAEGEEGQVQDRVVGYTTELGMRLRSL